MTLTAIVISVAQASLYVFLKTLAFETTTSDISSDLHNHANALMEP